MIAVAYAVRQTETTKKATDADALLKEEDTIKLNKKNTDAGVAAQKPENMMNPEAAKASIDYSKLFEKGPCPKVEGMKNIKYQDLSGDWYLQRTDEPSVPELLPACHHAIFTV